MPTPLDLLFLLTVPNPPLNISRKIVHLSQRAASEELPGGLLPEGIQESPRPRRARAIPLMEEREEEEVVAHSEGEEITSEEAVGVATQVPYNPPQNLSDATSDYTNVNANGNETGAEGESVTQPDWPDPAGGLAPTDGEEEFVNAVVPEYEDSNDPGSTMGLPPEPSVTPTKLPPILLELRWLPPRPPTAYDGFNIYIYREGKTALLS